MSCVVRFYVAIAKLLLKSEWGAAVIHYLLEATTLAHDESLPTPRVTKPKVTIITMIIVHFFGQKRGRFPTSPPHVRRQAASWELCAPTSFQPAHV